MALVFTNLAAIANNVDGTIFDTAAFTPSPSARLIAVLWNSKASTPELGSLSNPSWLSGGWGLPEINQVSVGAVRRLSVWGGAAIASPGSDFLRATFAATQTGCVIIVDEVTGTDLTDFILQPIVENEATGNTASITLADALDSTESAIWSACGTNANEAKAPTGGETELGDAGTTAPVTNLQSQFQINDTTSSVSWASSTGQITIGALEVKALSAATIIPDIVMQSRQAF